MKLARFAAIGLLWAVASAFVCAQGYVIDSWQETIDLKSDATFHVEERLNVTFNESRHGIFRDIPTTFTNGKGLSRKTFFSNLTVTDDQGQAYTTKIDWNSRGVHIRVGDKDVYLEAGTQKTYVIRYDVANAINWISQSDWSPVAELYWNVNGNDWDTSVQRMSVVVNFPEAAETKLVRARAFAGQYGNRAFQELVGPGSLKSDPETQTSMSLKGHQLRLERTAPLAPSEGLTVVLQVPEKAVPKLPPSKQLLYVLLPNLGLGIPLVMLLGMFLAWALYGKDPSSGPMVVQFDPPDDISGPAAGAFIDERVDKRDLAAGIISLAVKGYVRLHPKEEGLIFKHRTADIEIINAVPGSNLGLFETSLLSHLASAGTLVTELDLRDHVATHLSELRGKLFQELVDTGYYRMSPENARVLWTLLGLLGCGALGFLAFVISPTHEALPSFIGGALGAMIVFAFSSLMPRRTVVGARAYAKVKGFQEFIRRARGQELDWMTQKHPDMALFEQYLPHAIAFGLAAEWSAAFASILTSPPSWYAAPYGSGFNTMYFAHDLDSVSSSLSASAMTPPRSSGASGGGSGFSSGGGFSGGGFGGGGGGSW